MGQPRIGLLGGSFDPIHNAHLALARCARDQLGLDAVWLLPAGSPWQRPPLTASAEQRRAMVELAIAEQPGLALCSVELDRSGPSYSIDTLRQLQQQHPQTRFTFILGADQLANLTSWKDWAEIAARVDLAVASRPGHADACPPQLEHALAAAGHHLRRLTMAETALSASAVRAALADGQPAADFVPAPVARYIDQHHLYSQNHRHGHS